MTMMPTITGIIIMIMAMTTTTTTAIGILMTGAKRSTVMTVRLPLLR